MGPVFPSPIKIDFGVENGENSGETMTLSMLYKADKFRPGVNRRNVEVTHDKHAQGAGKESNACNQNIFEVGFEPLRHRGTAPMVHEPARGERDPGRESEETTKERKEEQGAGMQAFE